MKDWVKFNLICSKTREVFRSYQLERMRYYYAIIDCDSPKTASVLYDSCDGIEFESSAVRLDLRFVSDETSFEVLFNVKIFILLFFLLFVYPFVYLYFSIILEKTEMVLQVFLKIIGINFLTDDSIGYVKFPFVDTGEI